MELEATPRQSIERAAAAPVERVMERGTTISELLAEIDRKHRLLPYPNAHPRVLALSAALRVFVLRELMAKLADAEARASRRRPAAHRSYPTAHRRSGQFPWSLPEGMHSRPSKTTRMLRDVDPSNCRPQPMQPQTGLNRHINKNPRASHGRVKSSPGKVNLSFTPNSFGPPKRLVPSALPIWRNHMS